MAIKFPTSTNNNLGTISSLVGTGSSIGITIYVLSIYSSIPPENKSGFLIILVLLTLAGFVGQIIDMFAKRRAKDDDTVLTDIESIQIEEEMVTLEIPRQRIIISYRPEDDSPGDMAKVWKESKPHGQQEQSQG